MSKTILIVDDDPTIIALLEVNLEMEGYDVVKAGDGLEGLEVARATHPDLIVMDVMMPRMDGLTAREELLKIPDVAGIPFIFLSAAAQRSDIKRGRDLGAADYITKPFDPEDLLAVIERLLSEVAERQPGK